MPYRYPCETILELSAWIIPGYHATISMFYFFHYVLMQELTSWSIETTAPHEMLIHTADWLETITIHHLRIMSICNLVKNILVEIFLRNISYNCVTVFFIQAVSPKCIYRYLGIMVLHQNGWKVLHDQPSTTGYRFQSLAQAISFLWFPKEHNKQTLFHEQGWSNYKTEPIMAVDEVHPQTLLWRLELDFHDCAIWKATLDSAETQILQYDLFMFVHADFRGKKLC